MTSGFIGFETRSTWMLPLLLLSGPGTVLLSGWKVYCVAAASFPKNAAISRL